MTSCIFRLAVNHVLACLLFYVGELGTIIHSERSSLAFTGIFELRSSRTPGILINFRAQSSGIDLTQGI